MKQEDHTFALVKSLSMNEKRYFRLSATATGKKKNYLKVFDALDKMHAHDPKKLRNTLKGINLSYEKNYLQKQLLKSLRSFHADANSAVELQGILKSLEIIHRKRLGGQCQKLIDRGIELCKRFEQWHYHLELIDWQYRLYARTGNYGELRAYAENGLREKQRLLELINTYALRQEEVFFSGAVLQQKSKYMTGQERKRFEQLRRSWTANNRPHPSVRIAELEHVVQYQIHFYLGDLEQSYLWSRAALSIYSKHPQFVFEQPFKYFATKSIVISRSITLRKYAEALKHMKENENFVAGLAAFDQQEIRDEYYASLIAWQAWIYFQMRRPADALKAAKEFERRINPQKLRLNLRAHADYALSRIYFSCGMYGESLRCVNKQIRESLNKMRPDYLVYAFLLRLCIHAEQDTEVLIAPMAGALERFLKKNAMQDEFAYAFAGFLRKYANAPDKKMRKALSAHYYNQLKKMITPETERYEVILEWTRQKGK